MSNYDELIKKAQKEIEKLTAGIEKSKARIAELRTDIKEYETQKTSDLQFSDNLLELAKMQEYFQSIAAEKGENEPQTATPEVVSDENELTTETEEPEETDESADDTITPTAQNPHNSTTANHQNHAYPYRPTNNGNFNS